MTNFRKASLKCIPLSSFAEFKTSNKNDVDNSLDSMLLPSVHNSDSTLHPNSVLPFSFTVMSTAKPKVIGKKPKKDASSLPEFVQQPVDSYIIRGKSATLVCSVAYAAKAYFTCNGEAMAESPFHQEKARVEGGTVVKTITLEVTRNAVEEFFGQFSCKCDAWSAMGKVSSDNVSVETACKLNKIYL